MSEPMTSVEIEDVLSSIRRLVSEDLRPTHKLVTAALQAGAAKLILTPALRVVSNDPPGFVHTADDLDEPGDLQSVLQRLELPEASASVEIVPMFGSVRLQEMADAHADDLTNQGPGLASDANFLATAMSRINGLSASDLPQGPPPETIEAVVAAVGAAVGPDEWEIDGGDPAPQARAWADTVWNNADAHDWHAAQQVTHQPLVLLDPVGPATDSEAPFVHVDLGHVVEAVAKDTPEPPFVAEAIPSGDLMGQDSIIFHDDVSTLSLTGAGEQVSADAPLQRDNPADDDPVDAEDGAGFLNEDLLRDIVRDMIQAELQGTLGERITRNVRKLVRAEINRALASRDYE